MSDARTDNEKMRDMLAAQDRPLVETPEDAERFRRLMAGPRRPRVALPLPLSAEVPADDR